MKNFEKTPLSAKQRKAIDLLINSDLKHGEIADELKITKTTLSNWLNADKNPAFTDEYDRQLKLADAARQRVYKSKAQKAVDKLVELVECHDKKVSLAACKEILDRAGDKAGLSIEVKASDKLADIFAQCGGDGLDE